MSVIDNLNLINSYKSDIKQAIVDKGVDMTGVALSGYAEKIGEIETGSDPVLDSLSVSQNGIYTPGTGYDGFSTVTVDVAQEVTGFTMRQVLEQTAWMSNIYDASCTYVVSNVMAEKEGIKTLNLPVCTTIKENAFYACKNLSYISLPECQKIGDFAFYFCLSMSLPLTLPKCTTINTCAFQNCTFSQVTLPVCTYIGYGAFNWCEKLSVITMGASEVCTLDDNGLNNTWLSESGGSIYVPASLVDSYKTANNWSNYSDKIVAIPE